MLQTSRIPRLFRIWGLSLQLFWFFPPLMLTTMLAASNYTFMDFGVHFGILIGTGMLGVAGGALFRWFIKKHPRKVVELDREVLQQRPKYRFDKIVAFGILLYAVGAAVIFTGSIFLHYSNILQGLLNGIILYSCWILVVYSANRPYTQLFSLMQYILMGLDYLVGIAGAFFLQFFLVSAFDLTPLVTAFVFLTISVGILLNQLNLDQTMNRLKHNRASLPNKIRIYNLLLIGGIMSLLTFVLVFSGPILIFLSWCWNFITFLIGKIVDFIIWLFSLGDSMTSDTAVGAPPPLQSGGETPWWVILIVVVLFGFVFFLFGRQLFSFLKNAVRSLFNKATGLFERKETDNSDYYFDSVEDIPDLGVEDPKAALTRRQFRKKMQEWRKLTDPVQKVRQGYGLLLRRAERSCETVSRTDTVGEIREKAAAQPFAYALNGGNPLYQEVRYAERAPDPERSKALFDDVERVFKSGFKEG